MYKLHCNTKSNELEIKNDFCNKFMLKFDDIKKVILNMSTNYFSLREHYLVKVGTLCPLLLGIGITGTKMHYTM